MDDALVLPEQRNKPISGIVLILVVMDDALVQLKLVFRLQRKTS